MEETPNKSNPNGANQYNHDPRKILCWGYYISPKSDTFANAYQSAVKAGYEETYATQITVTQWFIDKVRRLNMLEKAEKVLDDTLEMNTESHMKVGDEIVIKTDPALMKIKQDTAKFIAERVGKEIYSNRTEHTGSNGKDLTITFDTTFKNETN